MTQMKVDCQHACRNTCAMLNEALRKEASMVRFYEGILSECNFPSVKEFLNELVEEKRKSVLSIIQKLNELHVSSQSGDGIISSFNFNG
ncbi:MAG: hypothetical protein HXY50_00125 [Ignavibacteriaceae bacterium]|nr:hypothetical protein [Ignavibacteriaceae bacterium]